MAGVMIRVARDAKQAYLATTGSLTLLSVLELLVVVPLVEHRPAKTGTRSVSVHMARRMKKLAGVVQRLPMSSTVAL